MKGKVMRARDKEAENQDVGDGDEEAYGNLLLDVGREAAHVDEVVLNAYEVVDHGLVGPLGEEWRDGIVAAIEDEEDRGVVGDLELEEIAVGTHAVLKEGSDENQ